VTRQSSCVGVLSLVIVALLASCGGSDESSGAVGASSTTVERATSASTSTSTPACHSAVVAVSAVLPADFATPQPGRGGAAPGEELPPCVQAATSRVDPGRHVTFGDGSSPYGLPDPEILPNGARRAEIHEGYGGEIEAEGGIVYVLGYGMTLAEFDAVLGSL
jgi:hypothetical protein